MGNKKKSLKSKSTKEVNRFLLGGGPGTGPGSGQATKAYNLRMSEYVFNAKCLALCLLFIVRLLVVLIPQTGYIQPDEFFQSTEPIAGEQFGFATTHVWEFNQSFPLRNMFLPKLISLPVFSLMNGDSSYLLLIGPRLVMAASSFLVDYSIYRLCTMLYPASSNQHTKWSLTAKTMDTLLIHASSYVTYIYYTHTFSNTIETILFGLLLVTVIDSLRSTSSSSSSGAGSASSQQNGGTNVNKHYHHNQGRSNQRLRQYLVRVKIAIILAFGFFNRPTFVLFASVPVLYWLINYTTQQPSKQSAKSLRSSWINWLSRCYRQIICNGLKLVAPFTVASIFLVLFDTSYYRGFDDLLQLLFPTDSISSVSEYIYRLADCLVLTPANFVAYNIKTANLANHGLHPYYLHALVNMPIMFSILAIIFYWDLAGKLITGFRKLSKLQTTSLTVSILYLSIIMSLIGFSTRPHQEPRFLLPLIIPIVCLFAHRLASSRFWSCIWILINFLLIIFYGHIHQAGVVSSLLHLKSNTIQNATLSTEVADSSSFPVIFLFARQYLPPGHLLTVPTEKAYQWQLHDLSQMEFPSAFEERIRKIVAKLGPRVESTQIYLTIPSCLTHILKESLSNMDPKTTLSLYHRHFPHFTAEDFQQSIEILQGIHDTSTSSGENNTKGTIDLYLTRLYNAFSMNIWQLNITAPSSPRIDSTSLFSI